MIWDLKTTNTFDSSDQYYIDTNDLNTVIKQLKSAQTANGM